MILRMSRVRVLGPCGVLSPTLAALQDLGLVHLAAPASRRLLAPFQLAARELRLERQLKRILDDVQAGLSLLGASEPSAAAVAAPTGWARSARLARRVRREAERLQAHGRALQEERALLAKYQDVMAAFGKLFENGVTPGVRAYLVVLRAGQVGSVERFRTALDGSLGRDFELRTHPLASGESVLLLLVPVRNAPHVERLLAESGVEQVPLPRGYEGQSLADAVPHIVQRLRAIPAELEAVAQARAQLKGKLPELTTAAAAVHDRLGQLEGLRLSASTAHAFVLEGWVPAAEVARLAARLAEAVGPSVSVEQLAAEQWSAEAPVVLHNPRLFRPFQLLVGMLPLPRYGSIDPTPFVAIFFPMFFGLMVGDVGYALVLGLLGLALRYRSRAETPLRAISEISLACALFTLIFGVLFGEFFGDLGRHWFGMRPLVLNREEPRDIISFLGLCLALGLVHVVLGLVLGVVSAFRGQPRQAIGRGLSAMMILLILGALLAAFRVLPHQLLTPLVVALLVAFPLLIIAEGLIAPVELLSTLGNILSYARIMALGTASVMLALVANRLAGAAGSLVVGIIFALLFHLINFGLALFSPTIQGLRLQYVEFFGRFYSPGGVQYHPFRHWRNT
ncbi:MAG: V-type ATP synthase subunit I [Myxococcaceae bacterium]